MTAKENTRENDVILDVRPDQQNKLKHSSTVEHTWLVGESRAVTPSFPQHAMSFPRRDLT